MYRPELCSSYSPLVQSGFLPPESARVCPRGAVETRPDIKNAQNILALILLSTFCVHWCLMPLQVRFWVAMIDTTYTPQLLTTSAEEDYRG